MPQAFECPYGRRQHCTDSTVLTLYGTLQYWWVLGSDVTPVHRWLRGCVQVPTLGADSVTKLTWFLRLGIKKGGDVKVTAQVTRPNRFATSRIVLHGINAVLGFCP